MNELTATNGQLICPEQNAVTLLEMRADAKRFPRIGATPREVAVVEMSKIISQAFLYKGQMADSTNIQFISCSLVDELQADTEKIGTRAISFAEIARIVKRAVLHDDLFGISVSTVYRVIIDYIKGEGHTLQKQVTEMRNTAAEQRLKNSIMLTMIQSYAGALINKKA